MKVLGHLLAHLLVRSYRSLVRLLAHSAHFQACGTVNDWMAIHSVFFSFWTIVSTLKSRDLSIRVGHSYLTLRHFHLLEQHVFLSTIDDEDDDGQRQATAGNHLQHQQQRRHQRISFGALEVAATGPEGRDVGEGMGG